jgi:hypothetical protein
MLEGIKYSDVDEVNTMSQTAFCGVDAVILEP